jgi:hypothetical protein
MGSGEMVEVEGHEATETGSPRYNVPVPNHQRIVSSAFKINGNGNGSTVCSQM